MLFRIAPTLLLLSKSLVKGTKAFQRHSCRIRCEHGEGDLFKVVILVPCLDKAIIAPVCTYIRGKLCCSISVAAAQPASFYFSLLASALIHGYYCHADTFQLH